MTYLLNLTFMVKKGLEDAVMTWINEEFAPIIYDPEIGFDKFEVFKLLTPLDPDNTNYCLQIRSTNRKYVIDWFETVGIPACDQLYKRYEDAKGDSDVIIYPSLMESVG